MWPSFLGLPDNISEGTQASRPRLKISSPQAVVSSIMASVACWNGEKGLASTIKPYSHSEAYATLASLNRRLCEQVGLIANEKQNARIYL